MFGKSVNAVLLFAAATALFGCQKLQLKLVDASVQKPSNVVLFFTVDSKTKGESIAPLTAENFRIFEDEQLLNDTESQLTMLDPQVTSQHFTMILLDMSAPSKNSEEVPLVKDAVTRFVENVGDQEKVAVYAFDGRKELTPIVDFRHTGEKRLARIERLGTFEPKDNSRNLNGGVIEATIALKDVMDSSRTPLAIGTLVVFTEGTDRAHRATTEEVSSALEKTNVTIFAVALGADIQQPKLPWVTKSGFVSVTDPKALGDAFTTLAVRIQQSADNYYLLSYCSPSRAGTHSVVIEAIVGEDKGRFTYSLDAEGFGPDCDPRAQARFGLSKAQFEEKQTDNRGKVEDGEGSEKDQKKKAKKKKKKSKKKKKKAKKKKKPKNDSDMTFE